MMNKTITVGSLLKSFAIVIALVAGIVIGVACGGGDSDSPYPSAEASWNSWERMGGSKIMAREISGLGVVLYMDNNTVCFVPGATINGNWLSKR